MRLSEMMAVAVVAMVVVVLLAAAALLCYDSQAIRFCAICATDHRDRQQYKSKMHWLHRLQFDLKFCVNLCRFVVDYHSIRLTELHWIGNICFITWSVYCLCYSDYSNAVDVKWTIFRTFNNPRDLSTRRTSFSVHSQNGNKVFDPIVYRCRYVFQ